MSFTNLFPSATLALTNFTSGGSFNPSTQVGANIFFTTSGQTFVASSGVTNVLGFGFATFNINAPGSVPGTIGVTFSGNTINSTVTGPVAASGGGGTSVVPFDFSSTPGLIAIGAIFGFKKGLDRLKAKKK